MILLELLKKGQFPAPVDHRESNYCKINYAVPEEKSIQFKISPAQNSSQSTPAQIAELKSQLITDLTAFNLQENMHYTINGIDTVTLTSAGYDLLQQQKENNANLTVALATPEKIMSLIAKTETDDNEDDEIDEATEITFVKNLSEKARIFKSILDKKDQHLSIEGSMGRTDLCFFVREEYRYIQEELFKALRTALIDIAPGDDKHELKIKEATLEKQNIAISISNYVEKNGNTSALEMVDSNSKEILRELVNGISSNSDNSDDEAEEPNITYLTKDDYEFISSNALRIKSSGMSKLKKANIDFFLRRESDILSEITHQSNNTQVTIKSLHIVDKQDNNREKRAKHTSLYLSDRRKTISNSLILALKKTSFCDTRVEITAIQSECIDIVTISKNNHIGLLHKINKIILATEIILPILNIKNYAQKLQAFSSDGDIIKAFKKHTDIYELDELFHFLLENKSKIDIHRNPTRDKMCLFHNTDSWKSLIHEIREYAYQQVVQKVDSLNKNQAIALINSCLEKAIFTTHRSNNIFNWLYSTETVKKLEKLLDEVNNTEDNLSSLVRHSSSH